MLSTTSRHSLLGAVVAICLPVIAHAKDHWPKYKPDPAWQSQVQAAVKEYKDNHYDYRLWTQDYSSAGDFLRYSKNFRDGPPIAMDPGGLPTVKYGDKFEYNPVTMTQFALSEYGKSLHLRDNDRSKFFHAVDKLIEMQGPDGAFRYNFTWLYYRNKEPYPPGWISGMAQGLALAALSRAYLLTHDHKYIDAGDRAFEFMTRSIEQGGTMETLAALDPSLGNYLISEEYISTPPNYTLNGYMFALLGVYDWMNLKKSINEPSTLTRKYFEDGISTLAHILPYYEIGGFSAYDLTHITFKTTPHIGVEYHYLHIALLHALYSVTHNPVLKKYEDLFISQVEDDPSKTAPSGDRKSSPR